MKYEPMSIIQRIYWVLEETQDWNPGTQILLYHKHEFEYWIARHEDHVGFMVLERDSKDLYRMVNDTYLLYLQDGKWHELFNWEDTLHEALKTLQLPEDL